MNSISLQFAEFRGDPEDMALRVSHYLDGANQKPLNEDPLALVVPHAGYMYSGPVAAYAYGGIRGKSYDTVIIIGPSHRSYFKGISVMEADRFDTPMGKIPSDVDLIKELRASNDGIIFYPEAHAQEHSVEVQLPFLQKSLKSFSLVMAVAGAPEASADEAFIDTIIKARNNKKILVVASSDLSHYHDYETARKMDSLTLQFIEKMDAKGLLAAANHGRCELCGLHPVQMAIKLAERCGYGKVKMLHAANSGDTAGPKNQVVGYASIAFLPNGEEETSEEGFLSPEEKKRLLAIARETISAYVPQRRVPVITEDNPKLLEKMGAFVTIKMKGHLRGCIGNFSATEPLYKIVMNMAMAAATQDPRFPPMTPEETEKMELEISVLSPLQRTAKVEEIEVGRHGLYIIKGHRSGVLLPQVATEYGWDRQTFLEQTCRKAGLPPDGWREGAEIYLFEAEVFSESEG